MSQLAQSRELRRHLRVDYQRRAWCEHSDWTQYLAITNLSHGGLFIQTPTPFQPGELLRVSFTDGARIVLETEVVWAMRGRQVGVGCQVVAFLEGEARYAELIDRLASPAR
jgi:Tfp pilus assembly protein PilZ